MTTFNTAYYTGDQFVDAKCHLLLLLVAQMEATREKEDLVTDFRHALRMCGEISQLIQISSEINTEDKTSMMEIVTGIEERIVATWATYLGHGELQRSVEALKERNK